MPARKQQYSFSAERLLFTKKIAMRNFWLSPNTEKDDLRLAEKTFLSYLVGKVEKNAEKKFKESLAKMLGVPERQLFLFNSGRAAFYTLLQVLKIKKVALQAYTCNAAVNPIFWSQAKPVYVDIDESLNLDPEKLKKTAGLRAVVVQHTFGIPAQVDKVKKFCQKNKLFLIEDCAHSLGGKYQGRMLGRWGDFAFFSFGRDKVISSVYGGALLVNNKKYLTAIRQNYRQLSFPSRCWTRQQLLHPVLMKRLIIPLYNFYSIGKIILYLSLKCGVLSWAVSSKEKEGKKPVYFPARLPSPLAALALKQLKKINLLNRHRRRLARLYRRLLAGEKGVVFQKLFPGSLPVYLRFGIKTERAEEIQRRLRKKKVFLDRWLTQAIGPRGTVLRLMGYKRGSCPRAEELAEKELQFPTGINLSEKEARELVKLFKDEYQIS